MIRRYLAASIVTVLVAVPAPALAQDSREDTITKAQAEKAARLVPYSPNKAEVILQQLMDTLVENPDGFYPYFDSVYSGGGFTLGAGYRRFIGDRTNWNVAGLYSAKNYKLIELGLHSPGARQGRFDFAVTTGWRDATQVAFYGLGIASSEDRSSFRMQQGYVDGEILLRPQPWFIVRAGLAYEGFTLSEGAGNLPSIEDVHTPATAPGLGASPSYWHTRVAAGIDSRPAADYARRGTLLEVSYHQFHDRADVYNFDRIDVDAVKHIPILRESWVLSLRGRLQTTPDDTDAVPYFLLPSLGSGSTLRGYNSWRFRDRHGAAVLRRMALDSQPPRLRRRHLLRHRHHGQSARRAQSARDEKRRRDRVPVP